MNESLESLLAERGDIWRAGTPGEERHPLASGFDELDERLGGGWPQGALTELHYDEEGVGELGLLMPALARLSQEGRWIAWIAPPHIPYAPALAAHEVDLAKVLLVHPRSQADALWATEQALRSGTCGAVLAWPGKADDRALRRLQLAAEARGCWGVLFRPAERHDRPSPAALRLSLRPRPQGVGVRLLKRRGGHAGDRESQLRLPFN
ncbi:translesion DNA synthesis-associated protein ImuA [Endothiovibrio diazotrophicus]